MADKLISADEVSTLPRGRKPQLDAKVTATLKQLVGNAEGVLVMNDTYGKVPQDDRQKVRAEIRKHWKAISGDKSRVRVRYSTEGIPQVDIKA